MNDTDQFEEHRQHLRAVAYRMLGSVHEADDAVQETWLRLNRAEAGEIENLRGWLTTVVSRVCLDMLRSRTARREDSLDVHVPDPVVTPLGSDPANRGQADGDPAEHAVMADSVGIALLVVLDTLPPAERLAFVLHDVFAVPFDDIGQILDRTPAAAKQLASRARQRLRATGLTAPPGPGGRPGSDRTRQRAVVNAFQAASRAGDFDALLALLDPDVVLRADTGAGPLPSQLLRGAPAVIAQTQRYAHLAEHSQVVLINGAPGFLVTSEGRPFALLAITERAGKITEIDILADPERLARLDLSAVLD